MKKFLLLFLTSLAFAGKIEIASIDAANSGVDTKTIEMLVRDAIVQQGETLTAEADRKLRVSLMPLGSSIIVYAEIENDGTIENSSKMKAENPDELDVVIERVVKAALANTASTETEEVGKISEKEQTELEARKGTFVYRHVGLGPSFWHNMDGEHLLGLELNYGRIWEASPQGAITFMDYNSISFGDDWIWHTTILIGGRYYFNASRISPYFGLGLGIGFASGSFEDSDIWGFAGGVSTGVVFFRTSETQLELGLSYDCLLDGFGISGASSKLGVFVGLND